MNFQQKINDVRLKAFIDYVPSWNIDDFQLDYSSANCDMKECCVVYENYDIEEMEDWIIDVRYSFEHNRWSIVSTHTIDGMFIQVYYIKEPMDRKQFNKEFTDAFNKAIKDIENFINNKKADEQ